MPLEIAKSIDTFRAPAYLDWQRMRGECLICKILGIKQHGRVAPHHTIGVGKSEGGDDLTVPVDPQHHPQSPKAFLVMCRELGLRVDDLVDRTQAEFCLDQGYQRDQFGNGRESFRRILIEAGLGGPTDDSRRVGHGTAKSKGKKLSNLRPLSKRVGTPTNPLTQ